ncbi:unnamed protein product [Spirodela intermedia]|uniref:Uncharacterized protein n=1 Tax=Spirodela intermedia TaxID=51605 RepID=A0A7I8IAQ1_SPIIN|nr:unnamed protein product [Spirodela intermedia]CAA6653961.1 unnamed protein product [Spirodela intermedia]
MASPRAPQPSAPPRLPLLFLLLFLLSPAAPPARAHPRYDHHHHLHNEDHHHSHHGDYDFEEVDDEDCVLARGVRLAADYVPGVVAVDGRADEWADVAGTTLPMLPALEPDDVDEVYPKGS